MHQHSFDPPHLDSPVHRLPALAKVIATLALILSVVSVPLRHAAYLCVPAMALLVLVPLSRISLRHLGLRLLMLEPVALGVAGLAVFQPGGWRILLLILAKCTLCFIATIVLGATTSISELVRVLRLIHLPALLITTILLMHRYLFVLADEAARMRRARASRTFTRRRWFEWRFLATIIGQLFIRSVDRADRVYAAMCARGWQ